MTLELKGKGTACDRPPQTRGSATRRSVQGSRDDRKTARQERTAEAYPIDVAAAVHSRAIVCIQMRGMSLGGQY
jgi:hypothetical protein